MEDEYKEIVQKIHLQKDCVYIIFSFKKKSYKLLSSVVSSTICMVLYILLIVLVDGFTQFLPSLGVFLVFLSTYNPFQFDLKG